MSTNKNQVTPVAADVATAPAAAVDHLINILKAGLSTAPFCGGIASLMSDYIPTQRTKRLDQFAERVACDLLPLNMIQVVKQ